MRAREKWVSAVGLSSLAIPGGALVNGPNWGGRVRGAVVVVACPRGRRAFWRWFCEGGGQGGRQACGESQDTRLEPDLRARGRTG